MAHKKTLSYKIEKGFLVLILAACKFILLSVQIYVVMVIT